METNNLIPVSPLSLKSNVKLIDKIESKYIIDGYKNRLKIDVSRYFINIKTVDIYLCEDTKYKFYFPFNTAGDGKFYEDIISAQNMYYSAWKNEYQIALDTILDLKINKTLNVLDVGCGFGNFLKKLKKYDHINPVGLEFNKSAIEHCKDNNIEVYTKSIEEYSEKNKEKFDVVCSFQVLEHVTHVNSFIESCISCLKPNGILILGTPNNNPFYAGYHHGAFSNIPPHHAGLWNEDVYKNLEKIFPLKLQKVVYDEPISKFYYIYFRAKYVLRNFFYSDSIFLIPIYALISLLISPFEWNTIKKNTLYNKLICIFKKS